ncbi:hypothetical protein [Streptomyces sp. NPDC088357]|uniref:hypothetical protein n=1 Tax=Streptomyces sp. NPDC088357 TaxID=3154655 RepID=UPI0034276A2A
MFSNCLVAIDAKTGERRWHFQSVHHDIWTGPAPVRVVSRAAAPAPPASRTR